MLRRDVRFAAVGGDPHHPRSGLIRRFQIVQRADARRGSKVAIFAWLTASAAASIHAMSL
ncbi:hypothetical protein LNP17_18075 [Klebsiella variicola subsp. variicola]|nr:hypothetical protein [Klebsiella variicola subsp. variicola]